MGQFKENGKRTLALRKISQTLNEETGLGKLNTQYIKGKRSRRKQ